MSKELPDGLRPKPVARNAQEGLAHAIAALQANVAASCPWLLIALDGVGGAQMHGTLKRSVDARAMVAAVAQTWAVVAEALHDQEDLVLAGAVLELLGAVPEYVSGGVVPVRK